MHGNQKLYLTAFSCLILTLPLLTGTSAQTFETESGEAESESCYVQIDALWLFRDNGGDDLALGQFRDDYSGVISTSRNDIDFDAEPGFRVLIGRQLEPGLRVEGSYFGLHDWDDATSLLSTSDFFRGTSPFLGREFDDSFTIAAGSELHNVELNLLRDLTGTSTSVLAGFRFIKFDDYLALSADGMESTTVDATNHAFGFQLGGQATTSPTEFLSIQAAAKGGLFLNFANQQTSNSGVTGLFSGAQQRDNAVSFAAAADLSILAKLQLTRDLFLRGGYQCLAVTGLAEADSQLQYASLSAARPTAVTLTRYISTDDVVLFHGLYLGGELTLP